MNPRLRRKLTKMIRRDSARRHDRLADRARLAATLDRLQEDGQIAIVYGGIDCDGGRWDDRWHILAARALHVEHWLNDYYDNAEGPQWHRLAPPSEVADLRPRSRDLALEAFENGHPHTIRI